MPSCSFKIRFLMSRGSSLTVSCSVSSRTAIIRSTEYTPAIRQRHVSAIYMVRPVLCLESFHRDGVSGVQRILSPTLPAKVIRSAAFDGVIRCLAGCILDVDVIVDMRIHPLHFRDGACKLDGLIPIVFGGKRMVCQHGRCKPKKN